MLKGILTICEDHGVALRHCIGLEETSVEDFEIQRIEPGIRRQRLRAFLEGFFGDADGCFVCRRLPAVFWSHCSCGCDYHRRLCRHHKIFPVACPESGPPPPVGTGTVPRQQYGRSHTAG